MEIEKTLLLEAAPEQVWKLLLDPEVMGACVPGMKSIEVVSDTKYLAEMHVKIAFVSARFKIKTTIVETRPPFYLRSEGTGEDTSVASSLKQVSEIFLTERPDGHTDLAMKIKVDVLGRLGTFGLSVMKTKADRMWDEFGINLKKQVTAPATGAPALELQPVSTLQADTPAKSPPSQTMGVDRKATVHNVITNQGWWSRLISRPRLTAPQHSPDEIFIEVRRSDSVVTVRWPVQSANECALWLRDYLK
jgi:carbon monoxide dehydrogenase subunit G